MKKRNTIAVDFLTATFKLNPSVSFDKATIKLDCGITLMRSSNKKDAVKNFHYCYNITINGTHYAKLYVHPSNNSFEKDKRICQIMFSNHIFYSEEFEKILCLLQGCDYLKLKLLRINRLDVAFDTNEDLTSKLLPYFNSINVNDGEFKVPFGMYCSQGMHRGVPSFQMGANKFINIYNKTKEIKQVSSKKYIQKFHSENGLKNNVTRVEIRLLNSDRRASSYLKEIDVWQLGSTDYLLKILKVINDKYFYFKSNLKSNVSRNPKEYILILPNSIDALKKPEKAKIENISPNMVKACLKYLLMSFWLFHEKEYQLMFWALVLAIVENHNLEDWLLERLKYEEDMYFSDDMCDFVEKFVSPAEVYAKMREAHFIANRILK